MPATRATRLLAKDVMTANPVCVDAAHTVQELARIFDSNEISGAPVVDGQHRLIGVVSKTDILHRALEGPLGSRPGSFFELMADGLSSEIGAGPEDLGSVEEFMSNEPIMGAPEDEVGILARRMADESVHRIIIVDEGKHPVGVVTSLDILRVFPR